MPDEPIPHLWEIKHPGYCEVGNFYKNGTHERLAHWGELYDTTKDWDLGSALLFRWDWKQPDHGVLGTFTTYWMGQGKATRWSYECPVHPDEEPAIREWLAPRLARLLALWMPLELPDRQMLLDLCPPEED